MTTPEHIAELIYRHLAEQITPAEQEELQQWIDASAANRELFEELNNEENLPAQLALYHPDERAQRDQRIWDAVMQATNAPEVSVRSMPRWNWIKYAAAIIILVGSGFWLYYSTQQEKPSVTTTTNPVPVQNDVAPGGNRATLTLADGSKIVLDSAANGTLATDGGATISKRGNEVIYDSRLPTADSRLPTPDSQLPQYNTMITPRGGQYQLMLPDGTRVWLNAESSITYPTAFSGRERERRVRVTGEVYFEVAKDLKKPFRVQVSKSSAGSSENDLTIEVLGTHFNVNAYVNEAAINTTLLEGSVRLTTYDSRLRDASAGEARPTPDCRLPNSDSKNKTTSLLTSLILQPGQQGQLNRGTNKLFLAVKPDIEQAVAWKNGVFNFNNLSLREAMNQLSRWYDVEVVYEGKAPDITFGGKIGMDLTLSQVLKGLSAIGVKYRIEGRRLIVTS